MTPSRVGGEATRPGGLSVGMSRTGAAAGTCTYMAPKQFDDAKRVDMRAGARVEVRHVLRALLLPRPRRTPWRCAGEP